MFSRSHFQSGINVVLDYLWGKSAERLLISGSQAVKEGVPIRFVQVGNASGANINLPAAVLRSAAIELIGSGLGSVPFTRIVGVVDELLQATVKADFKIQTTTVPLSEVQQAWRGEALFPRIVFTVS